LELRRQQHWAALQAPLLNLRGIEPFPVHDFDLMNFYLRPAEPSWPIPKGRIWRAATGLLAVHLRCEHDCEKACEDDLAWVYLVQHLQNHPMLDALVALKQALGQDLVARLALLARIQEVLEEPRDQGGTGLKLIRELKLSGNSAETEVSPYYLFTIYDQGLSRRLGLAHGAKRAEEFISEAAHTTHLGGRGVVQATDPEQRQHAIDWLLMMQEAVAEWPEAGTAAEEYQRATAAARGINRHLEGLQLQAGWPPGSRCEACQAWA
jgi:hypothetical protein